MGFTASDIAAAQGAYLVSALDPTILPGLDYIIGTIVIFGSDFYQKTGPNPTDWTKRSIPSGVSFSNHGTVLGEIQSLDIEGAGLVASLSGPGAGVITGSGGGGSNFLGLSLRFVDPLGSDVTGTGSANNPFQTIMHAMSTITDAAVTKRYVIFANPGRYTENLVIKANVFVCGYFDQNLPRIIGSVNIDPVSFAVAGDNRAGLGNLIVSGAVTPNFLAANSNEGKFYAQNCTFNSDYSLTAFSNINQSILTNVIMFGNLNLTGGNFLGNSVIIFSNANITSAPAHADTSFEMIGGYIAGNFVLNGTGRSTVVELTGMRCDGAVSLTGDGTTQIFYDVIAFPKASTFTISGTPVITLLSDSSNLAYVPAVPANWPTPAPKNVGAALDDLALDVHGSAAAPINLNPAVSLPATSALNQTWFIKPASGVGAVPMTANPQIAVGSKVGQKITLIFPDGANWFSFANGTGLNLNGPISNASNAAVLIWDGINWFEINTRI